MTKYRILKKYCSFTNKMLYIAQRKFMFFWITIGNIDVYRTYSSIAYAEGTINEYAEIQAKRKAKPEIIKEFYL